MSNSGEGIGWPWGKSYELLHLGNVCANVCHCPPCFVCLFLSTFLTPWELFSECN